MKFSSMWPLAVVLVVFSTSSRGSPIIQVFKNHHHHHHSPYPPPPPPLIPVYAKPSIPQLPIYEPVHVQPAYKPVHVPIQQPYSEYYQKEQYTPQRPVYQENQHKLTNTYPSLDHHHQQNKPSHRPAYQQAQPTAYPPPSGHHQQYQPTVYTQADSIPSAHLHVEHKEPQGPPVFVPGQTEGVSSGNLPPLFFGDVPSLLGATETPTEIVGDPRDFPITLAAIENPTQAVIGGDSPVFADFEIPSLIQGAGGGSSSTFNAIDTPSHTQAGGVSLGSVTNSRPEPIAAFETPLHSQGGGVSLGAVTNSRPEPIAAPSHSFNAAEPIPTLVETPHTAELNAIGGKAIISPTTFRPAVGDPAFNAAKSLINPASNSAFISNHSGVSPTHNEFKPSQSLSNTLSSGGSFGFPTERPVILVDQRPPQHSSSRGGKWVFPPT